MGEWGEEERGEGRERREKRRQRMRRGEERQCTFK